jgi:hypothetical protein
VLSVGKVLQGLGEKVERMKAAAAAACINTDASYRGLGKVLQGLGREEVSRVMACSSSSGSGGCGTSSSGSSRSSSGAVCQYKCM